MQQDSNQSPYEPLANEVVVMDGVVDTSSFVPPARSRDCGERLLFLIPGLMIGFITLGPNLMMSDSGSKKAMTAATIGLWASFMFVVAGVIGAILNSWIPYALPVLLQLLAFFMLS